MMYSRDKLINESKYGLAMRSKEKGFWAIFLGIDQKKIGRYRRNDQWIK